jgi:hypothetical protein
MMRCGMRGTRVDCREFVSPSRNYLYASLAPSLVPSAGAYESRSIRSSSH